MAPYPKGNISLKETGVVPDGMKVQMSDYTASFLDHTGQAQPVAVELLGRKHPVFKKGMYKNPRLKQELAKSTQYKDDFDDKVAIARGSSDSTIDPSRHRKSNVALYEPGAKFGGSSVYKDEFPQHDLSTRRAMAQPTYTSSVPLMGGQMALKGPFATKSSYGDDFAAKDMRETYKNKPIINTTRYNAVIVKDDDLSLETTTYSNTFSQQRTGPRFANANWERVPCVTKAVSSSIIAPGS